MIINAEKKSEIALVLPYFAYSLLCLRFLGCEGGYHSHQLVLEHWRNISNKSDSKPEPIAALYTHSCTSMFGSLKATCHILHRPDWPATG